MVSQRKNVILLVAILKLVFCMPGYAGPCFSRTRIEPTPMTRSGVEVYRVAEVGEHVSALPEPEANTREITEEITEEINDDNVDVVQQRLDRGADVNYANQHGHTALLLAARNGKIAAARLLLDRGADVNHVDKSRSTALLEATFKGRTDIAHLLIDHGADVNHAGPAGYTALMIAAGHGKADIVRILISRGASVDSVNQYGKTALMLADQNGCNDVVEMLRYRGKLRAKFVARRIRTQPLRDQSSPTLAKEVNRDGDDVQLAIAEILGTSIEMNESTVARGRRHLRQVYEGEKETPKNSLNTGNEVRSDCTSASSSSSAAR